MPLEQHNFHYKSQYTGMTSSSIQIHVCAVSAVIWQLMILQVTGS